MDKISETADQLIKLLFGSTEFYGDPKPRTVEILKELVEEKFTSTNTGSPKCEQCKHFDLSQGVYTVECYSCKRYCGDLFTHRAGA